MRLRNFADRRSGVLFAQLNGMKATLPGVTLALIVALFSFASSARAQSADGAIRGVAVGLYEATAELTGFAPRRQEDLRVPVGETLTIVLELRPATDPETITVAERPMTSRPPDRIRPR